MERWHNKIAVITGASSGIGWAIAKDLLHAEMTVISLSLKSKDIEELRTEITSNQCERFFQKECDLTCLTSLQSAFLWISENFDKKIHVLVNNAGMCEFSKILDEGNEEALKRVIDVNLMGAIYCTKEAYKLMKCAMAEGEECHVININSLLGHVVQQHIPDCGFNLYPVAKHAMRAANEVLRREMANDKLLRLSSISPGITETNFGTYKPKPDHLEKLPNFPNLLKPEDLARAVTFILGSPLHVTIAELLIVPTSEKF